MEITKSKRTAIVAGVGLIGGSVGMALRRVGWHVVGIEPDAERAKQAVLIGAVDTIGQAGSCDLAVVATPVESLAEVAQSLLDAGAKVVTDVGSVKAPVAGAIDDPRFIAGHPMAGNEQEGLAGAKEDLFENALWVLTPTDKTNDQVLTDMREVITSLGARVVSFEPKLHDELVAVVSHVPHLLAVSLTLMAHKKSAEHKGVLRLAAGGFRDMTRIAAGHPSIWPGIFYANQAAIKSSLTELTNILNELESFITKGDQEQLLSKLGAARQTRLCLPTTAPKPSQIGQVRIPVPDEKGQLAKITTLASDLDINIYDISLTHSLEGPRGVVTLLVDSQAALDLRDGLVKIGYQPTIKTLE